MALFPYRASLTLDPVTGSKAANADGQIFALSDTGFTTPLTAVDANGLAVSLRSNADAILPTFYVDGHTSVNWSSGGFVFPLVTTEPVPGPAGPAVQAANLAGDSLSFTLEGGTTTNSVTLPTGVGGSDSGVASYLGSPGSASRQALRTQFPGVQVTGVLGPYMLVIDESAGADSTFRYEDTADHAGSVLNIHHRGGVSSGGQAYGINLANHVGARSAVGIHQYSKAAPAVQIDNTDIGSSIYIKNTENQTMNPGGSGTGSFLQLLPFGETSTIQLLDDLTWLNNTTKNMTVRALNPANTYAFGVRQDADKTALQITKEGLGAGSAVSITNKGGGTIMSASDAVGEVFRIHKNGEVEIYTPAAGIVMRSANGTRYKVYVTNTGTLTALAV